MPTIESGMKVLYLLVTEMEDGLAVISPMSVSHSLCSHSSQNDGFSLVSMMRDITH